jgi:hypothetical protein
MSCRNCGRRTSDVDGVTGLCGFCHEIGRRLTAAGITPDDPAFAAIRDWNRRAYERRDSQ